MRRHLLAIANARRAHRALRVLRALATLAALVLVLSVGSTGCKKKTAPRSGGTPFDSVTFTGDASIAQPLSAGSRNVPFTIQEIARDQKPSPQPPFHEAGGSWTFFDAKTADGTPFGFGFAELQKSGSFSFGKVLLTVPDPAAGKRMVGLFAHTFEGKIPPEKTPHPLEPKPFSAAFLAVDSARGAAGGGFSGDGGGWYATKLFLQKSGIEAEVFFNFNLKAKTGEFSEKDADYANDMVAWLASELRDGPPAKRTPQTDPTLTNAGPKITWGRALAGSPFGMSPARDRYWVTQPTEAGGQRLVSLGFEREGDSVELLTVAHRLGAVRCAGDLCLAVDSRPSNPATPGAWSSSDAATVLLVDRARKTSVELRGEGEEPIVPHEAAAADGSLFVVGWYRKTGGNSAYQVLYLYGPDGKARGPVDVGHAPVDVLSVTKTRILVQLGRDYGKDKKLSYVAIDPVTLAVSPAAAPATVDDDKRSPDKKRIVECRRQGAEIVVREVATGAERIFAVHEDDRAAIAEGCVHWASSRFLEYRANVIGWLDVETMKIALGLGESGAAALDYDKDFKWVVDKGERTLRLGTISLRADAH